MNAFVWVLPDARGGNCASPCSGFFCRRIFVGGHPCNLIPARGPGVGELARRGSEALFLFCPSVLLKTFTCSSSTMQSRGSGSGVGGVRRGSDEGYSSHGHSTGRVELPPVYCR